MLQIKKGLQKYDRKQIRAGTRKIIQIDYDNIKIAL